MTPPIVNAEQQVEVAPGVHVITDGRVELVPNIGVIVGERAALVVDTGMGPANGERVLRAARQLAGDRELYLTLTHFHPEHGFGAQAFASEATILCNAAQAEELEQKGAEYLELFRTFGPEVAETLEGVDLVGPHVRYADHATIDLGGVTVELIEHGGGHTRGDQVVFVPGQKVLFAGDLVEQHLVPIFPPDGDADGHRWIEVLDALDALKPTVVVPGHGSIGGPELIAEFREYLRYLERRVDEASRDGLADAAAVDALEAEVGERYAGWCSHEWIRPGIESFQRVRAS